MNEFKLGDRVIFQPTIECKLYRGIVISTELMYQKQESGK